MFDTVVSAVHTGGMKTGIEHACSQCGHTDVIRIPNKIISQLHGKITAKARTKTAPRKLRRCEWCRLTFGTVELRLHKPRCEKRPPNLPGRAPDPKLDAKYINSLKRNTGVRVMAGGKLVKSKNNP